MSSTVRDCVQNWTETYDDTNLVPRQIPEPGARKVFNMSKLYRDNAETIGGTPLVRIDRAWYGHCRRGVGQTLSGAYQLLSAGRLLAAL